MKWDDGLTTSPPTCLFCDSPGPFNIEDVFPVWTRKVLPRGTAAGQRPSIIRRSDNPNSKPKPFTVLEATLRKAVCKDCNGGWMKRLEDDVKDIIAPMMNPNPEALPVWLDRSAQQVVAFWVTLKALCLELAYRQMMIDYAWVQISREEFRWMYDHRDSRESPPGAQAFLFVFRVQIPGTKDARVSFHHSVILSDRTNQPGHPIASLSTTTIGCFGFQVVRRDIAVESGVPQYPEPLVVPPHLSQVLIPIWPIADEVRGWGATGPAGVVTNDTIDDLAAWGSVFPSPESPPG